MANLEKFFVTEDNVNDLITKLSNDYPDISPKAIRRFFGSGEGDTWKFEPEWFENKITYEDLKDSFETWAYTE